MFEARLQSDGVGFDDFLTVSFDNDLNVVAIGLSRFHVAGNVSTLATDGGRGLSVDEDFCFGGDLYDQNRFLVGVVVQQSFLTGGTDGWFLDRGWPIRRRSLLRFWNGGHGTGIGWELVFNADDGSAIGYC